MFNTSPSKLVQPFKIKQAPEEIPIGALIARCRLKEARIWLEDQGLKHLPNNERGIRIVRWGADQAWCAAPKNHQVSVRRWCHKWAPWLTKSELDAMVIRTSTSNKRWSIDQCAIVLEVSLEDHMRLKLRHIGANDDPSYNLRRELKLLKDRNRKAEKNFLKHKPRSKALSVTKPWEELGISRRTWYNRGKPTKVTGQSIDNIIKLSDHR
jgi:hypothetical protein